MYFREGRSFSESLQDLGSPFADSTLDSFERLYVNIDLYSLALVGVNLKGLFFDSSEEWSGEPIQGLPVIGVELLLVAGFNWHCDRLD